MKTKSDYKINAIKNDAVDVESIKDLVKDYKYGQYTILENKFEIEYNPLTHVYFFKDLYNHEALSLKGTCTELMITAYAEIESRHPDYHVARVIVNEPDFFCDEKELHWALLVSKKKFLKPKIPADKEGIAKIVSQDPILVDPSFKVVEKLSKTPYKILEAYVRGVESEYYDSITLEGDQVIPLWYSEQAGCMAYLRADKRFKSGLGIVLYNKNLKDLVEPIKFDINSDLVKSLPDDDLRKMIEIIQKKEIAYNTRKDIKLYKVIIS